MKEGEIVEEAETSYGSGSGGYGHCGNGGVAMM